MTISPSGEEQDAPRDPTRVGNQPALRTSSGRIWLVMGTLFLGVSLAVLLGLALVQRGPSAPMAAITAVGAVVLYLAMILSRFTISDRTRRLRYLAFFMLSMAAVSLIGVFVSLIIERRAA